MDPKIFRLYDIRGAYPKELDENIAYKVGHYFGSICKDKKIIIGFDGRLSSESLLISLANGIKDGGALPLSIGLAPSPMLYFADKTLSPAASIMITASHNPKEDNGFKMLLNGQSFFGDQIIELREYVKSHPGLEGSPPRISALVSSPRRRGSSYPLMDSRLRENDNDSRITIANQYITRILKDIKIKPDLRVIWDIGNGAAGNIMQQIVKNMPNKNILLNKEINGNFPGRSPDPTNHKNLDMLLNSMKDDDYDLGIAFDGDGDRAVFVTGNGQILYGDQSLLIFAEDILASNPGAKIIAEVKSSQVLFEAIEKTGGKPIISKTGHPFIKAKMQETGALLAGELSGHIFFADKYFGFDDAIYAGLRMIDLLSRQNDSLEDLYNKIPKFYNTPEIKIPINESEKFGLMESIKIYLRKMGREFIDIDGARYNSENGWWLVRASNTESFLTVRCEGKSEEALAIVIADLKEILFCLNITF